MAMGVAESSKMSMPVLPPMRPAEKMAPEAVASLQRLGAAAGEFLPQLVKMSEELTRYKAAVTEIRKSRVFGKAKAEADFEKAKASGIAEMTRTREAAVKFAKAANVEFTEKSGILDATGKKIEPGTTIDGRAGMLELLPKGKFNAGETGELLTLLGVMANDDRFPPTNINNIYIYGVSDDLRKGLTKVMDLCSEAAKA